MRLSLRRFAGTANGDATTLDGLDSTAFLLADGSRAGATAGAQQFDNNVGIGTTDPPLGRLELRGPDALGLFVVNTATPSIGSGAGIQGLTAQAPSASGQRLGFYTLGAINGASATNTAAIQAFSTQAWSPTAAGTKVTISVTPNDSTARVEAIAIDHTGNMGIGASGPVDRLEVVDGASGASHNTAYNGITVHAASNTVLQLLSPNTSIGGITFGDPDDNDVGRILYRHTQNRLDFDVNAATRLSIASNGAIGVATTAPLAFLDLPPSTSAIASLRIRSGIAPTSPNDGDIWFDGSALKIHISGVTRTFTVT